jgi:uncharacterized membrane protein
MCISRTDPEEETMVGGDGVLVYVGTYYSEQAARDDFGVVRGLQVAGDDGTFSAAVITRGEDGHVQSKMEETITQRGDRPGIAIGAVVNLIFPPASIRSEIAGSGAGSGAGVTVHLDHGKPRSDVKEFADLVDNGQAALVIVSEVFLEQALENAGLRAFRHLAKRINVQPDGLDEEIKAVVAGPD